MGSSFHIEVKLLKFLKFFKILNFFHFFFRMCGIFFVLLLLLFELHAHDDVMIFIDEERNYLVRSLEKVEKNELLAFVFLLIVIINKFFDLMKRDICDFSVRIRRFWNYIERIVLTSLNNV